MLHVFGLVFKFSETIVGVKFQEELAGKKKKDF